jgi:glycosyltransferase involved in cell wall biosynthesis
MDNTRNLRVAVIIPCLNEEATIGRVLGGFRERLPAAALYVIDNNSSDKTAQVAQEHGARVLRETRPGKGFAVRRAFREVEADVYLLVDGDDTYPSEDADRMLQPILEGLADVVVGTRFGSEKSEFRSVNRIGNRILLGFLNALFSAKVTDLLSGYRAMTREFVKQVPVLSAGFELETELSVLALERGFRTVEIPIRVRGRPPGSHSKISVIRDGLRILNAIFTLLRDYRPLTFFGGAGIMCVYLGVLPGLFVTYEFMQRGTVRIPTAVLATGLVLSGLILMLVGVVLTALNRRFRELDYRLTLLSDDFGKDDRSDGRAAAPASADAGQGRPAGR